MPVSIHDNFLLGYEVDATKRQITLKTEFRERGEFTNVVFSGVEVYRFENDSFGTILSEIVETDPQALLAEQWMSMEAGYRQSGWPGPWAASRESAKSYLAKTKARAFHVESSVGLSGWVLASSMQLVG